MIVFNDKDLQARRFSRLVAEAADTLMEEFHQTIHAHTAAYMKQITHRGETGRLKAGWRDAINGRIVGPVSATNAGRIKVGDNSEIGNVDDGAAAVDHGRKRNHYPGFSRQGGSEHMPDGMTRPGHRNAIAKSDLYARLAVKRAEVVVETGRRLG